MPQIPYLGSGFEEAILGVSVPRRRDGQWIEVPAYQAFRPAFLECLLRQPALWDPRRPFTPLGRKLYYHVAKHYSSKKELGQLGLYSAVGTALDYYHGVDCLFFYGEPDDFLSAGDEARRLMVLIDLATHDKSLRGHCKADLVITRENFLKADLHHIGGYIARYLQGEITLKNLRLNPYRFLQPIEA